MPVISKINNKKMNIFNNQRFTIININREKELITSKYLHNDNKLDIEFNNFQKFFLPAYGLTCHCAQGLTIDEKYIVHHDEFDRMGKKLKYVALSRSKKHECINIMNI